MVPKTQSFLASACGGELLHGSPERFVSGISTDSRTLESGSLFAAISGETHDGHRHLKEAQSKGASLLMIERRRLPEAPASAPLLVVDNTRDALGRMAAAYRQEFRLPVVVVGGSNGKTSTKEFLAAALSSLGPIVASEASYNNDIGVPATLFRLNSSTRAAIVEVGSNHPGELEPLVRMAAPSIGIITSIGREHLEFFGDLDGVIQEEGTIAAALDRHSHLILNADTAGIESITSRTMAQVIRCGSQPEAHWRFLRIRSDGESSEFEVRAPIADYCGDYRVHVLGRHMVSNAVMALTVASLLGVPAAAARVGLAQCRPAKRRMNVHLMGGVKVIDDAYNANPDSMLAALQTLNDLPCAGRRVAVLGQMAELGPHSETAHAEVGRAAAHCGVTHLFAVGQHSEWMVKAARDASLKHAAAFQTAADAGNAALKELRSGDVVLVKASRSTRLETVVDLFREHLPCTPPFSANPPETPSSTRTPDPAVS